jgi:hypothetical protein
MERSLNRWARLCVSRMEDVEHQALIVARMNPLFVEAWQMNRELDESP